MHLGAGRENLNDSLDYGAGIVLNKRIGERVKKDEILMTLHTSKKLDNIDEYLSAFQINKKKKEKNNLIYDVIS